MFKSNAYKSMVNGKVESSFSDHHNCRLGKWYESGTVKERFSHLSSFRGIEKPHETVHKEVHKNLTYIENGDHSVEHQDEVIKNFQSMEEASLTLFTLMDALIRESEEEICHKRS
ncbi:MAG: CZB domain-containing protein [Sulfuricurvum sp.]|nr:CZB domain-containing protein [Sulfuricurvum sp.]